MLKDATAVNKYLKHYSEPQAQTLTSLNQTFKYAFILPIYDESNDDLARFLKMPEHSGLLSVWVFNCPDNAPADAQRRTIESLTTFKYTLDAKSLGNNVFIVELEDKHCLLIVDRCTQGSEIPRKEGVGLARKLGADIALNYLATSGLLFFSDVDAYLPSDYFLRVLHERSLSTRDQHSAFIFPFTHEAEPGAELANALYDFKLRYYVAQLQRASSPYAYHALGSIICADAHDYAVVRGVPRRAAGEDFYLLNKLAKINGIKTLNAPSIRLKGRLSHRVPFGTGPALLGIQAQESPVLKYDYYHPSIFDELAGVLGIIQGMDGPPLSLVCFENLLAEYCVNVEVVRQTLRELKIDRFFDHCLKQGLSGTSAQKHFHQWFDAFLTLRFIHILRDNAYPSVTLKGLASYTTCMTSELRAYRSNIMEQWG